MLRVADSSKSLYSGVPATFPFQMSPHELFIEPDHLQPVDLAQECVALVLEVFPDTDVEHIHTLVLTQRQTHDDSVGLAERVIDLLTHDTLSEGSEPVGDIECACCFSEVSLVSILFLAWPYEVKLLTQSNHRIKWLNVWKDTYSV